MSEFTARGALTKLSAAKQEPGLKSTTIDLNAPEIQDAATAKMAERLNDLSIENEKLRSQIAELLPWAEEGLERYIGEDPEVETLQWRIRAGEFGEDAS